MSEKDVMRLVVETLVHFSEGHLLYELYQIDKPRCVAVKKYDRCVAALSMSNDLIIKVYTRDTIHYFLTCFEVDEFLSGIGICDFTNII